MAKKRTNVTRTLHIVTAEVRTIHPIAAIVEDARTPQKYRILVDMVDVIFADVAQPDQARIVARNAEFFLKNGGHAVISIKASCIDSTAVPAAVFAQEVQQLKDSKFKPREQVTLEPYERDHAMVVGTPTTLCILQYIYPFYLAVYQRFK